MTAREMLEKLIEATPWPHPVEDVDQLLAAFDVVHAMRMGVFESAKDVSDLSGYERLLDELRRREAAWRDALGAAQIRVVEQKLSVGKLRSYAAG